MSNEILAVVFAAVVTEVDPNTETLEPIDGYQRMCQIRIANLPVKWNVAEPPASVEGALVAVCMYSSTPPLSFHVPVYVTKGSLSS